MIALRRPSLASLVAMTVLCAGLLGADSIRPQPAAARQQPLNLSVTVALVPGSGATLRYRGTFNGSPFGRGTANVRSTITGAGNVQIAFELSNARGSVSGTAKATVIYHKDTVDFRGTADITKGSGSYARMRARGLRISGTTTIGSKDTTLKLSGTITS
jgi:hypothetical protein